MTDEINRNLEAYDIETEVGRDDLTIIYRATRKSDGKPVMLRVLAPQFTFDTYFVRRFLDAVERNKALDHPNIVPVLDAGKREDMVYFATEVIDAQPLADFLAEHGPLSMADVLPLLRQIAAALDYAHAKAIRHGDLSDTSIFVADGQVWLADFGLTSAIEGTSLAKKGFVAGNPRYLSPERVKGESPSRTADLYALGIICYQMLAGDPPFTGEPAAVFHAQVYEQPAPLHEANRKVRAAVSQVVLRLLSKGLELRHTTGAEFVRALQVAIEGSAPITPLPRPDSRPVSTPTPAASGLRRRIVFWAFVLTPIIGCALAGGFWLINQWGSTVADRSGQSVLGAVLPQSDPTDAPASGGVSAGTPTRTPRPTFTPVPPTPTATATPLPTDTPTPSAAPAPPSVAADSPFTGLVLAGGISADNAPIQTGNIFAPTEDPIYLFFDYRNVQAGDSWGWQWKWADHTLDKSEDTWPADYGSVGTAWIFYAPALGYQPGPHSVSLLVNGQVVATAYFSVQ